MLEPPHFILTVLRDSMKFVLVLFLLSSQVFAVITPDEKKEALGMTKEVMMKLIGEDRSDNRIITASVTDEVGTRLSVEFSFVQDMSIKHKCSYSYDRVLKKVISDSWTCNF